MYARFAVAAVLLLGASAASGSAATAAGPLAAGDQLYVTNSALGAEPRAANVARFGIDAGGLISPAGTAPTGQGARGIVFTPDLDALGQRFAYVPSQPVDAIERYRVSAGGALTFIGTTNTRQPFGIAIHPTGRTIYVANFSGGESNGSVSAFHVESNGSLTLLNVVDSGAKDPKGVAVAPGGRFLYVSHGAQQATESSVLTSFAIGQDGSLGGQVAEAAIGTSGHEVVVTPDARFVYVTNQEAGDAPDIFGFRIGDSGQLTPVSAKPFEAGVWTEGAALSPDGRRLYVTALDEVGGEPTPVRDGQVRGFEIRSDGTLSEIEQLDFGFDPVALAFGLDGRNLHVADFSGHTVTVFTVDASGNLAPAQTVSSQGPNPGFQAVAVQPARGPFTTVGRPGK